MALRNFSYFFKYFNRYRLAETKLSFSNNVAHFNHGFNRSKINICENNNFKNRRLLIPQSNSNFLVIRCLSSEGPQKQSEINSGTTPPKMPPLNPDEIAKAIQDVQSSTLKSMKLKSLNNEIKKVDNEVKVPNTVKVSLKQKIKNELIHYYHGFRLLFLDTKVTCGILFNLLRGHTLTRREKKQLVRTVSDLFRMVPFLVFIIVPFMEFLLPFYIKFFPFMMPSTFKEKSKEAEKIHQLLKGKLEMAKFLQETLDETRNAGKYKSDGNISLETFNHFMKQARESGTTARTDDILKFSRLFEDEITLESLDHRQVKALCKLLDINSIGPKALLSFHLRMRVHQLKIDDKLIIKEDMSKIPGWELQQLCRERGMRAIGVSEERLRYQLKQWLKLSIENQVPISLLLLSRTMYLPESLSPEEQLTKAILNLPESISKEASLLTNSETSKFDNKTMFEVIKEEELAILEEKQAAESKRIKKETLVDKAPLVFLDEIGSEGTKIKAIEDESISVADLAQIESAIEKIEGSQTSLQEEELDELKEQAAELSTEDITSKTSTNKLSMRLQNMIKDMDSLLDKLDVEKETLMKKANLGEKPKTGKEPEERMIAISDLMKTLKQVKSVSHDEKKWQKILEMLDEDHDGHIEMHHVMEVMDLVDGENVTLNRKDIIKVLEAIDKEEEVEKEV